MRLIAAALLGLGLCACAPAPQTGDKATLEMEPCRLHGASGLTSIAAECGYLEVPENPADPAGVTISLFVARIPALNPRFPGTAFTTIAGGPGQASTQFYADYAAAFDRITRHHDVVVLDQRGTGKSNLLDCPYDVDEMLEFSVETAVARADECRANLPGDPRFYTTSVAVDDLDQVRAALGYDTLDVYGVSYGTRMAQHYLKQYPQRMRTMIIDGVVPAGELLGPAIALDAQVALEALFARCSSDEQCSTSFPAIAESFSRLAQRLRADPVTMNVAHPATGELTEVTLDYTTFAGTIRLLLYTPTTVALLPLLLHQADAQDNWAPLIAQGQIAGLAVADQLAEGMHNAIMCSEDAPFYGISEAQRAALAQTFLGAQQLEAIEAVCRNWPAGLIDDGFHQPASAAVPVLLLSGSADPITPPKYAERAAAHLPDSLHLIAQGHGHGVVTQRCVPGLIAQFVEEASLADLETDCVAQQLPAPFFTSFSGPAP
ncbi:MAG: alpha/beta hydrolase [Gammaproteobacteria bacterium]|nr:alpha/beta hydrolase [Gammaproteobacteria bacterium]NNF60110.1 alpha/beta fold hydrolase [Gammaproteobacteria bacterium]NNM21522.1 alpha/beta fold hydrolase [Gammaproteobacteria bacterium]